jgi:hypothetical protein
VICRAGKCILLLVFLIPAMSCARLPDVGSPGEGGQLPEQELPTTDLVPLEWGRLVTVTPVADGGASRLWFQDDSGQIRRVVLDENTLRLWPNATVIPRR